MLELGDEPSCVESADTVPPEENDSVRIESVEIINEATIRLGGRHVDCIASAYDLPDGDGIQFLNLVREEYDDLPFGPSTDDDDQIVAAEPFP